MKFIAKFWRANPQLKNGGYETSRKIEAETISAAKKLAYEIEKKAAYGSMSLRSIEEAEAPVEATTQEATEEAAPTAKKLYSAMVKDGMRVVIIRDQDYPNKAAFIRDLRANGYRVNPKKVKPSDVFDYICEHTNMNPWDWDLKKVPGEEVTEEVASQESKSKSSRNATTATFKGRTVKIPKGYRGPDEDGFYMNGHGVQYALVQYGFGEGSVICLETVYSKHVRTIELEEVEKPTTLAPEEPTAPKRLRTLTDDQLLTAWESTEHLKDPQCPAIRGWLMDEIERRYPVDFNAWLDQDAPEDSQLRKYIMAGQ